MSGQQIIFRGAVKRYGAVTAVDGVDLDVEPGEFLVLLGPSGSGKSTLIRMLAGIERLDGGSLQFGDRLIADERRHVRPDRRDLAMVFQDYALWPHLTALGNVKYALRRRHLDDRAATLRAQEALARVGLNHLAGRYPNELSGGEQQRVGLARAVVARPALLLFDEPLSNLDADLRERLRVEIATLTRESGASAVYITHDQSEAFALADRIAVMQAGRIVQFGAPEEIYRQPASPFVARFTGLSGTFEGRALGYRGEHLSVAVGGTAGAGIGCRAPAGLLGGSAVTVMVRPAATGLRAPSGSGEPLEHGVLRGTVVDIAYRGRGYDHVVDCGVGQLTSVHAARAWERGAACEVVLDPDGCTAFAEHAAPSPQPPTVTRSDVTTVTVKEQQPMATSIPGRLEEIRP